MNKKILSLVFIFGGLAVILFGFNNCQGMDPAGSSAASSNLSPGRQYYQNVVLPATTVCLNCHTWNYEAAILQLGSPSPTSGGTALNNRFINKMSGSGHGGGDYCAGDKNNMPCAAVRDWWTVEFAQ